MVPTPGKLFAGVHLNGTIARLFSGGVDRGAQQWGNLHRDVGHHPQGIAHEIHVPEQAAAVFEVQRHCMMRGVVIEKITASRKP